MSAKTEAVELQKAQRKIDAAQSKYDNSLKRWYLEAAKKSRAMQMAGRLGEMHVYTEEGGYKAIRRVGT